MLQYIQMNGEILWNLEMVLYDHWIHSMFGFDVL